MRILTIIPARCGSKGIKNKNIIDLCGKPLIAYSINQALELKAQGLVNKVIVSTDCQKIADVALRFGAEIPFLRPKEISGDNAKSVEFILHALNFYENIQEYFDAVLLLQPTSPMRSYDILNKSIKLFKSFNKDSLISVYKEEYINDLVMYKNIDEKELHPLNPLHNKGVRRQEHGSVYVRNGSIYITSTEYLKRDKLIISDSPLFVEMSKMDSINIDTIDDLELLKRSLCK